MRLNEIQDTENTPTEPSTEPTVDETDPLDIPPTGSYEQTVKAFVKKLKQINDHHDKTYRLVVNHLGTTKWGAWRTSSRKAYFTKMKGRISRRFNNFIYENQEKGVTSEHGVHCTKHFTFGTVKLENPFFMRGGDSPYAGPVATCPWIVSSLAGGGYRKRTMNLLVKLNKILEDEGKPQLTNVMFNKPASFNNQHKLIAYNDSKSLVWNHQYVSRDMDRDDLYVNGKKYELSVFLKKPLPEIQMILHTVK